MVNLNKESIAVIEYDLNLFYEDLGLDEYDVNQWAEVYTIQPSIYVGTVDDRALRFYLEAFKLTLEETRAIAPDFPLKEWGTDFFIGLEEFYKVAKAVPERVRNMLNRLPDPMLAQLNNKTEIAWIN